MPTTQLSSLKLAASLLVIAGLYLLTAPRFITFEDAGLFQQVCHFGGIAHPPGYPLFTLICTPAFALGFDPILTGNLVSICFGLLTLVMLYFVLAELDLSVNMRCFTVLVAGIGLEFWSQSLIIEVYTLNTFLLISLIFSALCFRRTGEVMWLWLGALGLGLSLANHWPLSLLSLPGIALIFLAAVVKNPRTHMSARNIGVSSLLFTLGLSPYLLMLLKPADTFGYSGGIETVSELIAYVSRSAYAEVDDTGFAGLSDKVAFAGWFSRSLFEQQGWALGLVALAGLWHGLSTRPLAHLGLLLVAAGNSYLLIGLLGFEYNFQYQTAFSHYPIMAYLCWSIWIGVGAAFLTERITAIQPRYQLVSSLVMAVLLAAATATNFQNNDRAETTLAENYATTLLRVLPSDSALVVDADAQMSALGYKRYVEALRPDVDIYEWENAFTFNELPADRATYLQELTVVRPVYSIEISGLPRAREYPLFQAINAASPVINTDAATLALFHEVALAYRQGNYRYGADLSFAHQFLIGAGNYLFDRVLRGEVTAAEAETLVQVQQTFPGAIAVASMAMATGSRLLDRERLLALLAPYDEHFPEAAMPGEKWQYYIMLSRLVQEERAVSYIERAAAAQPDRRNPAWCYLNPDACQVR
jgi:hypothetical protein